MIKPVVDPPPRPPRPKAPIYPQVLQHIAGSTVVVYLAPDHYIDARRDVRINHDVIEVVRSGQVYHRETPRRGEEPDRIVQMMRNFKRGVPL